MVANSWVNLTESNRGSLPAGTVLQYSCDPGYVADGPSTLTCTPLGHWSAEPPRCVHSGRKTNILGYVGLGLFHLLLYKL
jgi:hypothetical protein